MNIVAVFRHWTQIRPFLDDFAVNKDVKIDLSNQRITHADGSVIFCKVVNNAQDCDRLRGLHIDMVHFSHDYWRNHPKAVEVESMLKAMVR